MRRISANPGPVILLILLGLLAGCGSLAQRSGPEIINVESLLTPEEFGAAGLDTLSEKELAALDRALTRAMLARDGREVDKTVLSAWEASEDYALATFGLRDEHPFARQHDSMSTRLGAPVRGWSRGQEIPLSNGQVWRLTESAHSGFGPAEADTAIVIKRSAFDSFRLQVADRNFTPRVRRVE